jgi:hypothetical protein
LFVLAIIAVYSPIYLILVASFLVLSSWNKRYWAERTWDNQGGQVVCNTIKSFDLRLCKVPKTFNNAHKLCQVATNSWKTTKTFMRGSLLGKCEHNNNKAFCLHCKCWVVKFLACFGIRANYSKDWCQYRESSMVFFVYIWMSETTYLVYHTHVSWAKCLQKNHILV